MHSPKRACALLLLLAGVSSQAKAKEHTTFSPVPMYRRMQEEQESIPLVGASLSCAYEEEEEGQASKAIDGNTNGEWGGGSVANSCESPAGSKWLEIDLDPDYSNYFISNIRIYNRAAECVYCQTRLVNTHVWILNAENDVIASKEITDLGSNPDVVDVAFDYVSGGKSVQLGDGVWSLIIHELAYELAHQLAHKVAYKVANELAYQLAYELSNELAYKLAYKLAQQLAYKLAHLLAYT
eukprot:scaffold23084_cov153-Skeletonema_dohrnii-CCMP3373.AAC.5